MTNIFRKNVANGSFSDEQLDKALVVTPASLWIAIVAGASIIAVVLVWSILGRMPIKVSARGIYVPDQNSYTLASEVTGIVKSIDVSVGDSVEVGDVLYTIDTDSIEKEKKSIEDRIKIVEDITTSSKDDVVNSDTQSLLEIKYSISASDDSIKQNEYLLDMKAEHAGVLEDELKDAKYDYQNKQQTLTTIEARVTKIKTDTDLITKYNSGSSSADYDDYIKENYDAAPGTTPDQIKTNLTNAYSSASVALTEASTKYSTANSLYNSADSEVTSYEQQIAAAKEGNKKTVSEYVQRFNETKKLILYNLESQLDKYNDAIENNTVTSSVNGIVSDIKVSVGSAVGQGTSAVTIRETNEDEDIVICYVGIQDGKKIKPGMSVKIYPSIVNKNEYGNIEATVVSVDDYVTSTTSIKNDLGDDTLTSAFASQGPVIGVRCQLSKDDTTASGYKWSSKKAKDITIPQGTIVSADIITEEKKPISMLIPYLKDQIENFGNTATN